MYSNEHINFIKKQKRKKRIILFFQIIIFISIIFIWQLAANIGIINTFIMSSPSKVLNTIVSLSRKDLWIHIGVTVYETIISFSLGTILGILIATILWWNKTLQKILDPYLTIINSLPKVALGPLILVWFGAGTKSIIIMALLISLIITIINVNTSFNQVNKNKIKMLKSFNANKLQLFTKLILPSSFSNIISTLKVNISMTLIGVIMGEFLVSKKGIGYLIVYGSQIFNLNLVITGILILALLSFIMYYGVLIIEKKIIKNKT